MKRIALALALLAASWSAQAQPWVFPKQSPSIYTITGYGVLTCGKYAEMRETKNKNLEGLVYAWFQGYVTARNEMAKKLQVGSINQTDVMAYFDKFCRDNPLVPVAVPAGNLYVEVGGEKL